MPRGFAAATIWPPSRCDRADAAERPGVACTVTSWPRRRRSAITSSPKRDSTASERGAKLARVERRDQVVGVPLGRVDRLLQVQPAVDVAQKNVERPLLLLVAARRAVGEPRLAVAEHEPRRERRPRPLPRRERRRRALPRARTSARACRAASRAPGSSASSAASRRSASPRPGCRSGRRRRGGRCRRASARRRRPLRGGAGDERRQPPETRPKLAARLARRRARGARRRTRARAAGRAARRASP